jgi:putative ABC transport system ATP-binding protein
VSAETLVSIDDMLIRKQTADACFELIVPQLRIRRGEMVAVVGTSGCGKSTLFDVLALAAPIVSVGRFLFAPAIELVRDVGKLMMANEIDGLASLRRRYIGYVLQTGGLLPFLNVERNIALMLGGTERERRAAASELAADVGIAQHLKRMPADLSAGERQRVAICRALINRPSLILADEPTAALDPHTSDAAMGRLAQQVERLGASCLIATHDWDRVERLGLRRFRQHFEPTGRIGWTRSVIQE